MPGGNKNWQNARHSAAPVLRLLLFFPTLQVHGKDSNIESLQRNPEKASVA